MFIIYEQCQQDIGPCIRYSFLFAFSLFIAILSLYWAYKYYKSHGQFYYEIAPMLTCSFQAILHTIQFSIYNCNQLLIITCYIQLITFALISQSLANLCFRFKYSDLKTRQRKYRLLSSIKILIYLTIFVLQCVLMTDVPQENCNKNLFRSLGLIFLQFIIVTAYSIYFGYKLITYIRRKRQEQLKPLNESSIDSNLRSECQNKSSQIKQVVISQICTLIASFLLILVIYTQNRELICFRKVNKEETLIEHIIMIIFYVTQQAPCVYVPYTFYYKQKTPKTSQATVFIIDENNHKESHKESLDHDDDSFINMITSDSGTIQ